MLHTLEHCLVMIDPILPGVQRNIDLLDSTVHPSPETFILFRTLRAFLHGDSDLALTYARLSNNQPGLHRVLASKSAPREARGWFIPFTNHTNLTEKLSQNRVIILLAA